MTEQQKNEIKKSYLLQCEKFIHDEDNVLSSEAVCFYVEDLFRKLCDITDQSNNKFDEIVDNDVLLNADYVEENVEAKEIDFFMPKLIFKFKECLSSCRLSIETNNNNPVLTQDEKNKRFNNSITKNLSTVFAVLPQNVLDRFSQLNETQYFNSEKNAQTVFSKGSQLVEQAKLFPQTGELSEKSLKAYVRHIVNKFLYSSKNLDEIKDLLDSDPILNANLSQTEASDFAKFIPQVKRSIVSEFAPVLDKLQTMKEQNVSESIINAEKRHRNLLIANNICGIFPNTTQREIRKYQQKNTVNQFARNVYIRPTTEVQERSVKRIPDVKYSNLDKCYVTKKENLKKLSQTNSSDASRICDAKLYKSKSDMVNGIELSYQEKVLLLSAEQLKQELSQRTVMRDKTIKPLKM